MLINEYFYLLWNCYVDIIRSVFLDSVLFPSKEKSFVKMLERLIQSIFSIYLQYLLIYQTTIFTREEV